MMLNYGQLPHFDVTIFPDSGFYFHSVSLRYLHPAGSLISNKAATGLLCLITALSASIMCSCHVLCRFAALPRFLAYNFDLKTNATSNNLAVIVI
jgi:hypothetical protein